jgi:hypothetical protein
LACCGISEIDDYGRGISEIDDYDGFGVVVESEV